MLSRGLVLLCILVAACRTREAAPALTLAVTIENDVVSGSDNNYTNGVGVSILTGRLSCGDTQGFLDDWVEFWSFLPALGDEDCSIYASWTLGHEIYTPNEISDPDPQPDDQPWAGILFLDSTLFATTPRFTHAWNLRLGMVGPSAHADDVQDWYHELMSLPEPKGWEHQLPDELVLNVDYTLGGKWLQRELRGDASCRIVPLGGVSLGNYFTGVSAGMYGEIGWNLSSSVGLLSIRRGVDSFAIEDPVANGSSSLSLLVGGGGFAVAHYLPLDGLLFEDSPSVDSEPLVGFLAAGLTWRNRWGTLAYLYSDFSQSFEGEIERGAFGTLTLSWTF